MTELNLTGVQTLDETECRNVSGGGAAYQAGVSAGASLRNAVTFEPVVAMFSYYTDMWYGV